MSANVRGGKVVQLDRNASAEPTEQVTPDQLSDAPRIARLLMGVLRDLATLKRRWWPDRIDYEDVSVDGTGTTLYRFSHGFDGRVRFLVVDWVGAASPNLSRHAATDNNTLVLTSTSAGVLTVRVEESG